VWGRGSEVRGLAQDGRVVRVPANARSKHVRRRVPVWGRGSEVRGLEEMVEVAPWGLPPELNHGISTSIRCPPCTMSDGRRRA
jgi:hypothetical protein